jgi:hypothetical protein
MERSPELDPTQVVASSPHQAESKHARVEGKRTKGATGESVQDGKLGGDWKFQKNPTFLKDRVQYFDSLLKV